jgi:A/G-specific adenine glycosylase
MLQRTGGQQVLPVYEEFVARFPTIEDATNASEQELAEILRPLGRTERFRVFAKALVYISSVLGGRLPKDPQQLQEIPGVGPYTARAVACLGFGRRLGLFDPTVARVLERVYGIRSDRSRPHTDRSMWATVDALLPSRRVREFNLALLDFGALVCRKRNPLCPRCPMNDFCIYWNQRRISDG